MCYLLGIKNDSRFAKPNIFTNIDNRNGNSANAHALSVPSWDKGQLVSGRASGHPKSMDFIRVEVGRSMNFIKLLSSVCCVMS